MRDKEYIKSTEEAQFSFVDIDRPVEPEDEKPNAKETFLGLLLGIGYLTIFSSIIFVVLRALIDGPYTEYDNIIYSTVAQVIAAVISFVLMILISRRVLKKIKEGVKVKALLHGFLYALLLYFVSIVVSVITSIIFGEVETNANQSSIQLLMLQSPGLGFFFVVIAAPIIEELIFRYYLFGPLSKKNIALAFIITSLGFGLIHMFSSFASYAAGGELSDLLNDLKTLPDYVIAGAIFCFIYHKSKHITYSICAHMIYNFIATMMIFISISNTPAYFTDVSTTENSIVFTISSRIGFTSDTITSLELYDYTDGVKGELKQTYDLDLIENLNYKDLSFNDLESGKLYLIVVSYTYETYNGGEDLINPASWTTVEDSTTTYAKTRG